jgi:hypothetical protein
MEGPDLLEPVCFIETAIQDRLRVADVVIAFLRVNGFIEKGYLNSSCFDPPEEFPASFID